MSGFGAFQITCQQTPFGQIVYSVHARTPDLDGGPLYAGRSSAEECFTLMRQLYLDYGMVPALDSVYLRAYQTRSCR